MKKFLILMCLSFSALALGRGASKSVCNRLHLKCNKYNNTHDCQLYNLLCEQAAQPEQPAQPQTPPEYMQKCRTLCSNYAGVYSASKNSCTCNISTDCDNECSNNGGMFEEASQNAGQCLCKTNSIEEWCNTDYQCGGGNLWGWPTEAACKQKCSQVWGKYFN